MPKLEQGVQQIRSSVTLDKTVLPGIEKALDQMETYLRALKEAHELENQALGQVEAGVGHLQEATLDLPAFLHEEASLATLMQYYEVSVLSGEEFWVEVLARVDPPTYTAAWNRTPPKRQGELASESSEEFWFELLDKKVDPEVFAAAWNKIPPRRQGQLASKIAATREPTKSHKGT